MHISAKLLFEPRDLWIGLYWDKRRKLNQHGRHRNLNGVCWDWELKLYFIIVPMFPFLITTRF